MIRINRDDITLDYVTQYKNSTLIIPPVWIGLRTNSGGSDTAIFRKYKVELDNTLQDHIFLYKCGRLNYI
jgi:hypothetical protein